MSLILAGTLMKWDPRRCGILLNFTFIFSPAPDALIPTFSHSLCGLVFQPEKDLVQSRFFFIKKWWCFPIVRETLRAPSFCPHLKVTNSIHSSFTLDSAAPHFNETMAVNERAVVLVYLICGKYNVLVATFARLSLGSQGTKLVREHFRIHLYRGYVRRAGELH